MKVNQLKAGVILTYTVDSGKYNINNIYTNNA